MISTFLIMTLIYDVNVYILYIIIVGLRFPKIISKDILLFINFGRYFPLRSFHLIPKTIKYKSYYSNQSFM